MLTSHFMWRLRKLNTVGGVVGDCSFKGLLKSKVAKWGTLEKIKQKNVKVLLEDFIKIISYIWHLV